MSALNVKLDDQVQKDLCQTRIRLLDRLMQEYHPRGCWPGRLSSSALSTAVATIALGQFDRGRYEVLINRGLAWLAQNANEDGGWGDTPESSSNLSTTLLCSCALNALGGSDAAAALNPANQWLHQRMGDLQPASINTALLRFYGQDRTFSIAILTVCALSGRFGSGETAWDWVPQLPFELSVLPRSWFPFLNLQVVSYALPALIAIGLVRFRRGRPPAKALRWLRNAIVPRALNTLGQIQPESGGFLEAVPLTAFVVMSLAAAGLGGEHPVATQGARFLESYQRPDGSWPIDANLATWLTTLVIHHALQDVDPGTVISPSAQKTIQDWIISQQHRRVHPFTRAAPGGWAWTDLSGGVPDADDTAGALLALARIGDKDPSVRLAANQGVSWLLNLQNADGGIPTFCRGWGKLPFDRSCPDITAHALRALQAWQERLAPALDRRLQVFQRRAWEYLVRAQNPEGAWTPLWFGNQQAPGQHNLTYGTSQVLLALDKGNAAGGNRLQRAREKAVQWLLAAQNTNGSWGGGHGIAGSVEETSLALSAIMTSAPAGHSAVERGLRWLLAATQNGTILPKAPIGLYFASLWYDEVLYPLIFFLGAIHRTPLFSKSPS